MGRRAMMAAVLGGSLLAGTGCEQETVYCGSAHGDFAVKLTLKSGTGACSELKGGWFGVQSYNYPDDDGGPDAARASIAIQAEEIGVLIDEHEGRTGEIPDAANKPYSQGDFASGKPKDDFCEVPSMTVAQKNFPALEAVPDDPATTEEDESLPAVPATSISYQWSNMRFMVTPAVLGTQFSADLTYTVDGCTAEYEAWGLYPAVYCGDEEGNPQEIFCDPEPHPELGIPIGSGINPDVPTICDPDLLLCVLTAKPPSLK